MCIYYTDVTLKIACQWAGVLHKQKHFSKQLYSVYLSSGKLTVIVTQNGVVVVVGG